MNEERLVKIRELLFEVDDLLVHKFFDVDSEELLDEKIEVLTKLKNNITPDKIDTYYKILELYPKDENQIWDL